MEIIKLKNINKNYGNNIVFDNYNLTVKKGEYICIMGKSGAGKSTLLNIIGLLEAFDSGTLEICNINNPKINSKVGRDLLRYHISYLFQNYGLIEEHTVEKNILIATKYMKDKSNISDKIREVLSNVGLVGFEKKKVYQLSGGEQQRVALAKIMIKPSEIILADEPTGSLDSENKELVLSIIDSLHKKGKTIVMVSHDDTIKKYAERIEILK